MGRRFESSLDDMKPLGYSSRDTGCCPGHDKVPYKAEVQKPRGQKKKINRKARLTRYWKRAFKNKSMEIEA